MTTTTEAGPARTHVNGAVPARPTPPIRQRNVARIAIGTLVLVLSTLGVVALTAHTGATRRVLIVRHSVAAGEPLHPGDLATVAVDADLPVAAVSASKLDRFVGQAAAVTLVRGALLSPSQIATSTDPAGTALVGATLSVGQYPSTLQVGDRVLVVTTETADSNTTAEDPQTVRGLLVELVTGSTSSEPTVVTVRVPVDAAPQVAAAGAGHVSLVSVGR
jgi:hypothetical protein